jgi:hypothetical protein
VGSRAYDSTIGRFVSVDPVLNPADQQSVNGYSYADDNPITESDPSGACPIDKCGFGTVNNGTWDLFGPLDPGNPDAGYVSGNSNIAPGEGGYRSGSWPSRQVVDRLEKTAKDRAHAAAVQWAQKAEAK